MGEQESITNYEVVLSSCVGLANKRLVGCGLEPIDPKRIKIVSPEEYERRVCDTSDQYRGEASGRLLALARGSAAIVLPRSSDVLFASDAVDVYDARSVDPQNALLAGSFAHEWYHLRAMDCRQEITQPRQVPIYGGDYKWYFDNYDKPTYTLVGPGLEVRSEGKLVALQINLNEFMADLQRYLVISPSFDLNDLIANIVYLYKAPKKIMLQQLPKNLFDPVAFRHLCAVLCVASMDAKAIGFDIGVSCKDPVQFLTKNSFGPLITNHFAHYHEEGEDDKEILGESVLMEIVRKGGGKTLVDRISDVNLEDIGQLVYKDKFKDWIVQGL